MAKAPKKKVARKKKLHRQVTEGMVFIKSTFSNTIITITDQEGNVLTWATSGAMGFKGSRKSTPFAAQTTSEAAAKKAIEMGMKKVTVHVKGPGSGKEAAIRSLTAVGLTVSAIKDITNIPHNGCRPTKRRRV